MRRITCAVAAMFLTATMSSWGGGELPARKTTMRRSVERQVSHEAAEVMRYSTERTRALYATTAEALEANRRVATKYDRLTEPIPIVRDKYGDPMYARYGPRAYAGSPNYAGPAYAASFVRGDPVLLPDSEYRGYYRGVYSHPQIGARTDVGLRPGASHSYLQSGMLYSPGSQASQADRPMMFNHQLAF